MPAELYGPAGAIAALAFVLLAILRGDLVPGWIYKRDVARADKAEAALIEALTKSRASNDDGKA